MPRRRLFLFSMSRPLNVCLNLHSHHFPLLSGWFAPGICPVSLGDSEAFSSGQKRCALLPPFWGQVRQCELRTGTRGFDELRTLGSWIGAMLPFDGNGPLGSCGNFFFFPKASSMLGFSFRRLREEREKMSGSGGRAVDGLWTGGGRAEDGRELQK